MMDERPANLYVFIRLEPKAGKREQLLEEMGLVLPPTRAEPGCLEIHQYESIREPAVFFIYSKWVDEAAFEVHAELPHTRRFLSALDELIANPFQALRTRQIR